MTFIVNRSKNSGKYRYGRRHPRDHEKWAFLSQGSWNDPKEARAEADLVEKDIQAGPLHENGKLIERIESLRANIKSFETYKRDTKEKVETLEYALKTHRIIISFLAIALVVALVGFGVLLMQ